MKIGKKIISLVMVAAIIPIIMMGIGSYIFGLRTAMKATEISYQGALEQGVGMFNNYFEAIDKKLEFLSKNYSNNLDKGISAQVLINNFSEGEETFIDAFIGTANKEMFIYPESTKLPEGYDPTGRPWYTGTIGKGVLISEPYEDASTKQMMISVSKEIKVNGQTVGVAGLDIDFAKLRSYIEGIPVGKRGFVSIVDKSGLILFHSNPEYMSKNFAEVYDQDYLANVISKEKFDKEFKGDNILTLTKNIKNSSLYLVLGASKSDELAAYAPTRNINIGILLFAVVVSLLALVITNRSIVNPINQFSVIFKKGTNGELNEKIELHSKDELELLANDYNTFISKLGITIINIKDMATKVSVDNEIVSNTINALIVGNGKIEGIADLHKDIENILDRVRNQTASSEESLAAAEEITRNGKDIINNMNNIIMDLDNSLNKSKQSQISIQKVGLSIEDISEETKATTVEVGKLYILSQDIGNIITAITSIAARTNLLALNAAIESARAGEAGRGFAVVADEIRKLAEQTNRETEKISSMISSIQNSVDNVKIKGQIMMQKVADSTILSNESQASITEIMNLTDKNNKEIKSLSNAVNDQIYASTEIMTAVNQIAESSIEIEELCTNTSHISTAIKGHMNGSIEIVEELKELSKELQNDLEFFKV